MAIDFNSDVGKVRLQINDLVQKDYDNDGTERYLFSDVELETFLGMAEGKILSASARAILAIALNEALISKVIRTEDLQTDGAKLATELRLQARDLFKEQSELDKKESGISGMSFVFEPMQYPYKNIDW